ncbi:hypothetical protein BDN70DRAFT_382647 [Pholiota conissans]|uniref:Uncharacterized protein n=1 Tax=Pholiota conissans TaxID=109636 RepID=A0A9P6CVB9_9AGAR|nr:hypothetical protein BDN70DRAFT_382647 [Pholiota conissans]
MTWTQPLDWPLDVSFGSQHRLVHAMKVDSRRHIDSDHVHRRFFRSGRPLLTTHRLYVSAIDQPFPTLNPPPTTPTHRPSSLASARIPCPCLSIARLIPSCFVSSRQAHPTAFLANLDILNLWPITI